MKAEHLTNVTGRISEAGVLRLTTPNLGLCELWSEAAELTSGAGFRGQLAKHRELHRTRPGNVVVLRCGRGSKAAGFSPQQWVFLVDGRPYARVPGPANKGQCFLRGNRWHTRVVPLRGRRRAAVLAAWAALQPAAGSAAA